MNPQKCVLGRNAGRAFRPLSPLVVRKTPWRIYLEYISITDYFIPNIIPPIFPRPRFPQTSATEPPEYKKTLWLNGAGVFYALP